MAVSMACTSSSRTKESARDPAAKGRWSCSGLDQMVFRHCKGILSFKKGGAGAALRGGSAGYGSVLMSPREIAGADERDIAELREAA
jgi:hypothetical protein